jgi:sugar lactone lactonase YvrE
VQAGCLYDPLHASIIDVLTSKPRGRLLRYTEQGGTEVLLDGIHFANGMALARDESFVLINETPRARVLRFWLQGPKGSSLARSPARRRLCCSWPHAAPSLCRTSASGNV